MSELFNIYEDNLNSTLTKISNIVNTLSNLSREKSESAIKEANTHIQEAETLLKKLELEVNNSNNNENLNINNNNESNKDSLKIKKYKNELDNLKKKFVSLQEKYIKSKTDEALYLNSEGEDEFYKNKKLVDNEHIAYNQHSKLENAKGIVLDVENRANDVMRNLDHQTKQMNIINSNLDNENDILHNSNSLMFNMLKRENRNKLYVIVAVVVVCIGILIVIITNLL